MDKEEKYPAASFASCKVVERDPVKIIRKESKDPPPKLIKSFFKNLLFGRSKTDTSANIDNSKQLDDANVLEEPVRKEIETRPTDNSFFTKIFAGKNSKTIALIGLAAVAVLIMLNIYSGTVTGTESSNFNNVNYTSSTEYAKNLEDRLKGVLGSIKGAGNVEVMITLETSPELKIATSVDKKTNTVTNGNNTTTTVTVVENPVLVTSNGKTEPLVLMEVMPKIQGVIIVSQGAASVQTKLDLLQAAQSLLGIPGNSIQIYAGI